MKQLTDTLWKRILIATAIFAVLAVIHTFPLATQLSTHIPGYGNDIHQYYWAHWWYDQAKERNVPTWRTDMQWYPNGTSLVFSTNRFGSAALGHMLKPVFGSVGSYNIVIILAYIISALGVYLLVVMVIRNELGAYLAAYVFAFNPFKLHALMHHHFLLGTYVFGFAVLLLWLILDRDGWHWFKSIGLGILMALMFYESFFLSIFLVMTLATVFVVMSIVRWRSVWHWKKLVSLALVVVVALAGMWGTIERVIAAVPEYGGLPQAPGTVSYSNDLLHLVWPSPLLLSGPGQPTAEFFTPANQTYRTAEENFGMPGWFLLIAAGVGWWMNRKNLLANISFGGMLFFMIMSLGPVLWVGGSNTSFPLLYGLLSWAPLFSMIRTPSRFVLVAFLFAGLLAAFAVKSLQQSSNKKMRWLAIALVGLVFFDFLPLGVDTYSRVDLPAPVQALKNVPIPESGPKAVVQVNTNYGENLLFGSYHERPITSGYTSRTTLLSRPLQDFSVAMIQALAQHSIQFPKSAKLPQMAANVRRFLASWGDGVSHILFKGKPRTAKALADALQATVVSQDNAFSLILLDPVSDQFYDFAITPNDWPKTDHLGITTGEYSKLLWSFFNGFNLAIPDSMLGRGRLALTLSSALWTNDRAVHTVVVYVNREPVGKYEIGNRSHELVFNIPEELERQPVNLVAVRNLLERTTKREQFPFNAEIASGNNFAGNLAGIMVNGKKLLPFGYQKRALFLASSPDGTSWKLHDPINFKDVQARKKIGETVAELADDKYLIICHSGTPRPVLRNALIEELEKIGIRIFTRQMKGKSFVFVIDLERRRVTSWEQNSAIVSAFINKDRIDMVPVLNIEKVESR